MQRGRQIEERASHRGKVGISRQGSDGAHAALNFTVLVVDLTRRNALVDALASRCSAPRRGGRRRGDGAGQRPRGLRRALFRGVDPEGAENFEETGQLGGPLRIGPKDGKGLHKALGETRPRVVVREPREGGLRVVDMRMKP